MKTLFIVESPLQLINAYEARYAFRISDNDAILLVLNRRGIKNFNQIKEVLKTLPWQRQYVLPGSVRKVGIIGKALSFLLEPLIIRKKIKVQIWQKYQFDQIFIGDYYARIIRAIVHSFHTDQMIFLLDDGHMSISVIRQLFYSTNQMHRKYSDLFKDMIYKFLLADIRPYNKVALFTCYADLVPKEADRSLLFKNSFDRIKSLNKSKTGANAIYFLGNPFTEKGIMAEKDYLDQVDRVLKYINYKFKPGYFFYLPHRMENSKKLSMIEHERHIHIKNIDRPVELHLLESDELPVAVCSLFSSALDTTKFIFSNKIQVISFYVPLGKVAKPYRKACEYIYKHFHQIGLDVIYKY